MSICILGASPLTWAGECDRFVLPAEIHLTHLPQDLAMVEAVGKIPSSFAAPLLYREAPATVQVAYEDFAGYWQTPNIWTPEQQEYVRNLVIARTHERERRPGYAWTGEEFFQYNWFRADVVNALKRRIQEFQNRIRVDGSPATKLKISVIDIHLEGARAFRFFHRHGRGQATLVLSEKGEITEGYNVPRFYNDGGMSAIMTDGFLHRPPEAQEIEPNSEMKPRLSVFVGLSTDADHRAFFRQMKGFKELYDFTGAD